MKVLHICWDLGQGGIQRYLVDLLRCHRGQFDSKLLVLSQPGPLTPEASEVCETVDHLNMNNGFDLLVFFRIRRFLASVDYDLVHSHINNVVLGLALSLQDKPVVFTEHGGRLLNRDTGSILSYRFLSFSIDRFIAISQYMADLMCAENPSISDRVSVIYNGVDHDYIANVADQSSRLPELPPGKKVGFTGRLTLDKGIDLFIETAKYVAASYEGVQFIVIGDGPEKEAMKALVEQYSLQDAVTFLGYKKNARDIANAFDITLFTSRYEGFGLVIVESMATGVPVVAMHERSAVQEIIRDGVDGIIVNGLKPKETAEAVVRLLMDDESRTKMGESGKEQARKFTMEKNAHMVAKEYLALLSPVQAS